MIFVNLQRIPASMKQSDVRPTDVLANERTFLAYLRTALSFIAFGFVIARFSLFAREMSIVAHLAVPARHASTEFGTAMAAAGIAIGLYGAYRYVAVNAALSQGQTRALAPAAAIAGSVVVAIIGVVVAIDLFAFR
jgi:putative membrane protein